MFYLYINANNSLYLCGCSPGASQSARRTQHSQEESGQVAGEADCEGVITHFISKTGQNIQSLVTREGLPSTNQIVKSLKL